ncbi:hypothetical protein NDU88_002694 [Pleurodeles waltl]|uniref:Uncharacterized protein n=1 Tax=Pleurodeles waltl TaxID=8319 RepID=A0AAV7QAM3_PLEWA|nr:hypothetical protein NDU88_002694 [Pleurodeles waltl]
MIYGSPLFRLLPSPPAPASRGSSRREGSTEPAARSPARGGLQIAEPSPGASCTARGTLARGGPLSRRVPVPGPGRACLAQVRELSSHGSPSPGFPSVLRAPVSRGLGLQEGSTKPAASLLRPRGLQVAEPVPGTLRAARGTPVGDGPVSRQAPISGPAKTP